MEQSSSLSLKVTRPSLRRVPLALRATVVFGEAA
jgi:hypothetical protein